jgi:hypothetical protein
MAHTQHVRVLIAVLIRHFASVLHLDHDERSDDGDCPTNCKSTRGSVSMRPIDTCPFSVLGRDCVCAFRSASVRIRRLTFVVKKIRQDTTYTMTRHRLKREYDRQTFFQVHVEIEMVSIL